MLLETGCLCCWSCWTPCSAFFPPATHCCSRGSWQSFSLWKSFCGLQIPHPAELPTLLIPLEPGMAQLGLTLEQIPAPILPLHPRKCPRGGDGLHLLTLSLHKRGQKLWLLAPVSLRTQHLSEPQFYRASLLVGFMESKVSGTVLLGNPRFSKLGNNSAPFQAPLTVQQL